MKILYGKRVTLFPFSESDVKYFHFLLQHEGYLLGQVFFKNFDAFFAHCVKMVVNRRYIVWTVWTKEGKASKKIGFIALSDFTPFSVNIHGFSDKSILKGLVPLLKREDKYTFAEDSFRTVLDYCFDDIKIKRVVAECFSGNIPCKKLIEKVGFKKEGRLREAVIIKDEPQDILIYGMLKKEKDNAIREQKQGSGSGRSTVRPEAVRV